MIHQYKIKDMNIVLDVYSGAVHVVDDLVYDIIALYEKLDEQAIIEQLSKDYDKASLLEGLEEVCQLEKDSLLFTKDIYKELAQPFLNRKPVVKALCLHVSHDCNLRCKYCFAGEGDYQCGKEVMSSEVGKKAMDFLVKESGNRINLEVDFFGGEPLMNLEVIKEIVDYARGLEKEHHKNFRFTITTNGVLLNEEVREYLNDNMVNVVLSLDGRKNVHDKMRPAVNGSGSYDVIMPKFQKMAELRNQQNYYIRGTYTQYNKDFAKDVLHLADLGFKQISVEPVVAFDNEPYALTEEDIEALNQEYENLAEEMLNRKKEGKGFNFFHFMIDLSQGPCVYKRLGGCGAGSEYMAVAPKGDLYPCHQFVGTDGFVMGNVYDGITNKKMLNDFQHCNVYSKEACTNCWAKFYCSGGCSANGYSRHGSIHAVDELGCELQKKRVEIAIYMKAREMMEQE